MLLSFVFWSVLSQKNPLRILMIVLMGIGFPVLGILIGLRSILFKIERKKYNLQHSFDWYPCAFYEENVS